MALIYSPEPHSHFSLHLGPKIPTELVVIDFLSLIMLETDPCCNSNLGLAGARSTWANKENDSDHQSSLASLTSID